MTLIKCPKCKKKVSEKVESCPNCGYTLSPEMKDKIKAKQKKYENFRIIFWISLIAIVIIVFTVQQENRAKLDKENEKAWKENIDKVGAYLMAETFVKKHLKSPSTAEFSMDVLTKKKNVTYLGDQTYQVSYYVDSQNSFGAMIRTNFVAVVEQYDKDMWQLISLEFDE